MAIINGTFNTDISGWTSTHDSSSYYNTSIATYWDNGKAHVRSGSRYGGAFEAFAYFYQRFLVDKPILVFDIQALISGDGLYACGNDSTCGWALKNDAGTIIAHGKPGTTLTTVSIDVSSYINQYLTITFAAGAARDYNEYYDLLVDNVMIVLGMKFDPICGDTGQHCPAYLYLDNNFMGITPYTTMLSIGTHNYSLFKQGYNRFDGTLNITSTDIANAQSTGISFEPTISTGVGGIINGTFDTDLSGWVVSGATWDNGRVHLTNGNTIYQIFSVTDNQLQFDYETIGPAPTDSGLGYKLYIDDGLILDKRLPGNYGNPLYGTENVYLGNYIGRTAKILFYEAYNFEGWIDNVKISHTVGIFNGTFSQGFTGWETSGEVSVLNCGNWPANWGPPCSGTYAQIGINDGGNISQTFVLDKCNLKFDWMSGNIQGYKVYFGDTLVSSKVLPSNSQGTETVDLSNYVGSTLKVSFYSNQFFAIDNVTTITSPYDISVISYPSGAQIYLDGSDTGQITGNTPVIIDGKSEGSHTVTLKLTGYTDYTETINIIKCQTTNVTAVFAGCITFITNPTGAKICLDGIDTNQITPKTFCGISTKNPHTYSLYLKNYKSLSGNITFAQDKGILINENLIYETGSAKFNVTPDGSKIIIDGTDTGKLTPDVIDNLPIGYHSYEIRKDNYYSLTGSFRSIVNNEKLISDSLQQVTGIANGTFDTDISGWTVTSSNLTTGYVEWVNGTAHLITNNIPITFSKDFVATEDSLVFNYYPPVSLNTSCSIGWNVIVDPDTPSQATIASYCGWGQSSEHWGYFEVDVSSYKGKNIRLNLNLTGTKVFYIGGPAEAYLDNVGNVPITRSITFDTYCIKYPSCALNPIVDRCSADIYLDGNFIGTNPIKVDSISLGNHSYSEKNKGYISIDTNTEDTTGTLTFTQGIPTHFYIDGLYTPSTIPPLPPGEGCVYIESNPAGAEIFLDGNDTGKVTPDTICNLSLTNHTYELKLLNHTVYKGSFTLYPGFGEFLSLTITGSIYFTSTPSGAEIFLDGKDLGIKTPSLVNNISAGNHTFTLKHSYYLDYTSTIYVIGEP